MGRVFSLYRGWYLFIKLSLPKDVPFAALGFQDSFGLLSEEVI